MLKGSSLTIWLVGRKGRCIMSDNKTTVTRTPIIFRPFKNWTGPRIGVSCKVNGETYRAVTMLPVATNEKQMKELYNLTKVQYGERAVKNIAYAVDSKLKDYINKAMKDQKKDLNKITFTPSDKIWFIEKKATTQNVLNETGWTQAELLEHAKKHPKTK